jgi:ABC-type cobalamin/Fe3+-siderophores transport system ATPase subunit
MTVLSCHDLCAGYGSMRVVRNIGLELAAGEIVALLGPNRAGETTTLLTLAGALQPQAGTVELFGRPARSPLRACAIRADPRPRAARRVHLADHRRQSPHTRFLTIFAWVTGMKHMPTGAFSSGPMTISRSRSDRMFQPRARVQNRASPAGHARPRRCDEVSPARRQYAQARRTGDIRSCAPPFWPKIALTGMADCSTWI